MSDKTSTGVNIEIGQFYEIVGGMVHIFKPVRFHESGMIGGVMFQFLSGTLTFTKWFPHDYMEAMSLANRENLADHRDAVEIRASNLGNIVDLETLLDWQERSKNIIDWFFTAPPEQTLIEFEMEKKAP